MSRPDFLCVGMQKAATGTLWRFLGQDDRFWMPMVKELSHFNHGSLKQNKVQQGRKLFRRFGGADRKKLANINSRRAARGRSMIEPADVGFVENYHRYLHNDGSDDDYLKLFSSTPQGKLTGDITPNYSGMSEDKIEHARRVLPHAHIILLLRNPVERLWSAYNMRLRHDLRDSEPGVNTRDDLDSLRRSAEVDMGLAEYINRPGVRGRSFPSVVYRKWRQVFGPASVHVVLFEDFIANQRQTVDELYPILRMPAPAAEVTASSGNAAAALPIYPLLRRDQADDARQPSVHKNQGTKMDISAQDRQLLEDFMAEEIDRSIELFGERFECWRPAK